MNDLKMNDLVKVVAENGETGLVTVVGCDHPDGRPGEFIEVLFGKDSYFYYHPKQLMRVGHKYDLPVPKPGRDVNWGDFEVGDRVKPILDCVPRTGQIGVVHHLNDGCDLGGWIDVRFPDGGIEEYFDTHLEKLD